MTEEELAAICEGMAPVVADYVQAAAARLELEIATLRDAVIALRDQVVAAETRMLELEAASAAAVRP